MSRRLLAALVLVTSLACRSAAVPPATAPDAAGAPAASAVARPTTPTTDPDNIRWVRDAAEYRALAVQTYRLATQHVEREAQGRRTGSWAVVLDADETVISNLTYQVERARQGLAFTPESWYAWVRRREAVPVPGAAAFLRRVQALGGRIAIVTNRRQAECDDTVAVFRTHALPYDAMLCRPDAGPSDKQPRFDAVAGGQAVAGAGALDVVAFLGDNIFDFPGLTQASGRDDPADLEAFGARFFVLPNPMYGSWQ